MISDDSNDEALIAATKHAVMQHPGRYLSGPRRGVCANRNNCLQCVATSDVIIFLDDDTLVESDFLANVESAYQRMSSAAARNTILVGLRRNERGREDLPSRLTFLGYFTPAPEPRVAGASYSAYPATFFATERWDENIYFGYEDAELSLRAVQRGYELRFAPELKAVDIGDQTSLTHCDQSEKVLLESARLYVGVKRYLHIDRNWPQLMGFVIAYLVRITAHLLRTRSLTTLPSIIKTAGLERLLEQ